MVLLDVFWISIMWEDVLVLGSILKYGMGLLFVIRTLGNDIEFLY